MKAHYGNIVEYTVRRNGVNIADLARLLKVNRRSLYNWFADENLKIGYIYKIGIAIRHDFSKEFPELFKKEHFDTIAHAPVPTYYERINQRSDDELIWKERYLALLENYQLFLMEFADIENQENFIAINMSMKNTFQN
jgi:AcrR family transcriptional regulator